MQKKETPIHKIFKSVKTHYSNNFNTTYMNNAKNKDVFASGISYYKLFWVFVTTSILGVGLEVFWDFICHDRIVMRTAFVFGLFIPVYGCGAVIFTLALNKLHKCKILLFVSSAFIGGTIEFLFSFIQEYIFGSVSWNYSSYTGNIQGRVDLRHVIMWGLLGIIWIKIIFPKLSIIIEKMPVAKGKIITNIVLVTLIIDTIISCMAVYRWSERQKNISAGNVVESVLDDVFPDKYMKFIYPTMKFAHKDSLHNAKATYPES